MKNIAINSETIADGSKSFHPHARLVGNFLYVSGIIATQKDEPQIPGVIYDSDGRPVGHDVVKQFESTIQNLEDVLITAGTSLKNVIDVTVFLTNIERDFQKFNAVYGKYFSEILPARTTVEVTRLPSPVCIELKVIALTI